MVGHNVLYCGCAVTSAGALLQGASCVLARDEHVVLAPRCGSASRPTQPAEAVLRDVFVPCFARPCE
eukprot:14085263-Alexandrium_andersonii.AAC.1